MNATSSGTPEQIRYLVELGVIPPLCDLLSIVDTKVVEVALNGLDNEDLLSDGRSFRNQTFDQDWGTLLLSVRVLNT